MSIHRGKSCTQRCTSFDLQEGLHTHLWWRQQSPSDIWCLWRRMIPYPSFSTCHLRRSTRGFAMCFMSSDCYHRTRVFHALSRNQHILVRKGAKATEIHNDTPEKWMLVLTEVQSRILVSVQTRRTSYLSCMLSLTVIWFGSESSWGFLRRLLLAENGFVSWEWLSRIGYGVGVADYACIIFYHVCRGVMDCLWLHPNI